MGRHVGEHDFIMPSLENAMSQGRSIVYATFSVGVFQWVPDARGLPKRGKAKVRVVGKTTKDGYAAVYDKALAVANDLDAGTYSGPKRVVV